MSLFSKPSQNFSGNWPEIIRRRESFRDTYMWRRCLMLTGQYRMSMATIVSTSYHDNFKGFVVNVDAAERLPLYRVSLRDVYVLPDPLRVVRQALSNARENLTIALRKRALRAESKYLVPALQERAKKQESRN